MRCNLTKDTKQIEASRSILGISEKERAPYEVEICGLRFKVLPDVFSPKYFGSTDIFARNMPFRREESFLEIGCGIGVASVMAALNGARKVLAVDINPAAVENARINARQHLVADRMAARVSNIFSAIVPSDPFSTIYWNMPFLFVEDTYAYRSVLERALYDPGYRMTQAFLKDARRFLALGGRLLVGFGDFGDVDALHQFAADTGYDVSELAREASREGGPVQFILYELTVSA